MLTILAGSSNQKTLLQLWPEKFSVPFAQGEVVDFCLESRCVSVEKDVDSVVDENLLVFYTDYTSGHWGNRALAWALKESLLFLSNENRLEVNAPMTRKKFLTMLYQIIESGDFGSIHFEENTENIDLDFTDIDSSQEFHTVVRVFVQTGVIQGYEDDTFRPDQPLTRAEAVKILLAVDKFIPKSLPVLDWGIVMPGYEVLFPDTTAWEVPWVNEAVRRDWVQGYDDGNFRPHQTLSRVEAVQILYRIVVNGLTD
jgi:hypothetical protein